MPRERESVVANASRDTVWTLLTNASHFTDWYVGLDTVTASPDYPAVGSKLHGKYKVMGLEFTVTLTVNRISPGTDIVYTMEGVVNGTQEWQITDTTGGVEISVAVDYAMSGGVLGKLAEPVVHQANVNNFRKTLANVKQQVEAH